MKWKFWKRSNKSKTAKAKKGKRQQKPEDCTECDSLRAIVDGEFHVCVVIFCWKILILLWLIKTIIGNYCVFSFVLRSSEAIVTKWLSSNRSWTHCMISSSRE